MQQVRNGSEQSEPLLLADHQIETRHDHADCIGQADQRCDADNAAQTAPKEITNTHTTLYGVALVQIPLTPGTQSQLART